MGGGSGGGCGFQRLLCLNPTTVLVVLLLGLWLLLGCDNKLLKKILIMDQQILFAKIRTNGIHHINMYVKSNATFIFGPSASARRPLLLNQFKRIFL